MAGSAYRSEKDLQWFLRRDRRRAELAVEHATLGRHPKWLKLFIVGNSEIVHLKSVENIAPSFSPELFAHIYFSFLKTFFPPFFKS